ncbi:MAG: DUF2318 domain-containing protein [Desulfobacterales bacterium]|nr:DUF2318 domain-containing protein [Desulfobacterales bacterium]
MKSSLKTVIGVLIVMVFMVTAGPARAWFGMDKFTEVKPANGVLALPMKDISDGKAHYYKATSDKGIAVKFFVVKSHDGVIRAAVDACDVCYRSGKGYVQEGGVMICTNCGMRFATDRINEVKGGCNPAPLKREVAGDKLLIPMAQINANAWLCEFKK